MWELYGQTLRSRLLLGTAGYPSPAVLQEAIRAAEVDVVTVALRRQAPEQRGGRPFWELIAETGVRVLPNTAGCLGVSEAVATARMARELFGTPWIKLEVIGDDYSLQPDVFGLVEAARELLAQGFEVLPYCTEDLVVCERLLAAGCRVLMPWAAPIGTGRGPLNPVGLQTLRQRFPDAVLIVDAGLGTPAQAAQVMEWGFDAVLLNSAVAQAAAPVKMAAAFRQAVQAGRLGHEAGLMPPREQARPSTPLLGRPFWQER